VIDRNPQILNATSKLLGICFAIIGGLKLTNSDYPHRHPGEREQGPSQNHPVRFHDAKPQPT
jgi:hypothetical protein